MSARLLEGRPVADAIWREVDERAAHFAQVHGRAPTLALVGGVDEAANAYGRQIERQLTRHGLRVIVNHVDAGDYMSHVHGLSADPLVDGILLLTPLPDGVDAERTVASIDPEKDVGGQHPSNLGRLAQRRAGFAPATALRGLRLLRHYGVPLRGARVVVVGRSPV